MSVARSSSKRTLLFLRYHPHQSTNRRFAHTSIPAGGSQDPATYCKSLVRKHDYDSYLCSYFYPRAVQDGYFALKAFNVELAMVRESVSKPVIGQMRMQFWRDAVKSIQEDKPPLHPIAIALHQASKKAQLAPYHLKRIIDARDQDLYASTHPTTDSLTSYAESTSSTLLYLLQSLLSQSSSSTHSHALSHIGVSQTITTLLRALPFHASNRRSIIPTEISSKHGLREEDLFRYGGSAEGLDEAVYEFATLANDHVITAREMYKDGGVPRSIMPVFLSAIPVTSYLQRLEKVNFDAFHPSLQTRDWRLPFQIWRSNSNRSF